MSREINTHKKNECNEAITIVADEPDAKYGNASHEYTLSFIDKEGRYVELGIDFQRGPFKEVGVNGLTNEALLAVLIDRMTGFQSGDFACDDNREVLNNLLNAMRWIQEYTSFRAKMMSKEDVEKAIEEVMEVVDEQLFTIDGTKAEAKAFHNGIIAACKRRIEDAKKDDADVEEEEEDVDLGDDEAAGEEDS